MKTKENFIYILHSAAIQMKFNDNIDNFQRKSGSFPFDPAFKLQSHRSNEMHIF